MPSVLGEAIGERSICITQTVCAAQIDEASAGKSCTGARAAKREVRVVARGRSSSQATIRSILIAAAVATGWTCVLPLP